MAMVPVRRLLACACLALVAAPCAPALATAGPGGAQAPYAPQAGGSQYGVALPAPPRPVLSQLSFPRSTRPGRPPKVTMRIDEPGVGTVYAQVSLIELSTHRVAVGSAAGWVHTGRTLTVAWPADARLAAGSYQVHVRAHDHHRVTLVRGAHISAQPTITVAPSPPPAPSAQPPPPTEAGVPTPAQTVAEGAVFPVAGPHSFGGPENRFGAPRAGHIHQGQDVLTAEGTPIVAPFAGTVITAGYQAAAAGYYLAEHTTMGFDFMFAHCEAASLAVRTGETVTAGEQLCLAGQTGDATTPHLHFEIWVGGWWAPGGHPIDPLAYLEAWERAPQG
jgi:biotin carboxyl carrier protein